MDEGRGTTESDSTDATSAVVDLAVPCEELSPVNVPELAVEAAETAEPRSEADSLSAVVDSATTTVSNVEEIATSTAPNDCIASAPECVSTDVSITPSIPNDPTDNILVMTILILVSVPIADILRRMEPNNHRPPQISGRLSPRCLITFRRLSPLR